MQTQTGATLKHGGNGVHVGVGAGVGAVVGAGAGVGCGSGPGVTGGGVMVVPVGVPSGRGPGVSEPTGAPPLGVPGVGVLMGVSEGEGAEKAVPWAPEGTGVGDACPEIAGVGCGTTGGCSSGTTALATRAAITSPASATNSR